MNAESHILVTGASGFLGNYLLQALSDRGYRHIRAVYKETGPGAGPDGIDWRRGDLMDPHFAEACLEGIDYVFHAAGMVSYHKRDRQLLQRINVELTGQLVNLCLDQDIRGLVFFSSTAALGRKKDGTPADESATWQRQDDTSDYGRSKFLAELEVWRGAAEGLPVLVLAPSVLVGHARQGHGFRKVIELIDQGTDYYPTGSGGFVAAADTAAFAIQAAEAGQWQEKFILSAENKTYRDIYTYIAKVLGKPAPRKPLGMGLIRIAHWRYRLHRLLRLKLPSFSPQLAALSKASYVYDTQKSVATGLIRYQPVDDAIRDAVNSFTNRSA